MSTRHNLPGDRNVPEETSGLPDTRVAIKAALSSADFSQQYLKLLLQENPDIKQINIFRSEQAAGLRLNLMRANLAGKNLSGVNLSGADLSCADLTGADLSDANLLNAQLQWATLHKTIFTNAQMSDAIMPKQITECLFQGARLIDADFLTCKHIAQSVFRNAIMLGAKFSEGIHFSEVDMANAILDRATMPGAQMEELDLSEASLRGTNMLGADLSGVKGLLADQLSFATLRDIRCGKAQKSLLREAFELKMQSSGLGDNESDEST